MRRVRVLMFSFREIQWTWNPREKYYLNANLNFDYNDNEFNRQTLDFEQEYYVIKKNYDTISFDHSHNTTLYI